ncbi:MAG: VOC family protein [Thermoanaerobaculia bacterium]|nr:VOC family protein [Thermoanaerobaculia bacterium]
MTVSGISEIVLIVSDVPSAAAFYRDVVGLRPESEPDDSWAWFLVRDGKRKQRLALHTGSLLFEEHSPLGPAPRWGPVHFALEVERSRLDVALARVRSAGVDVFGPTPLEWMRALSYYFYDPDGNLLELWSPDPDAPASRT